MRHCRGVGLAFAVVAYVAVLGAPARAEQPSQAELLQRLQRLEQNQEKLYRLLKQKDARLDELESELRRSNAAVSSTAPSAAPSPALAAPAAPRVPEAKPVEAARAATQ